MEYSEKVIYQKILSNPLDILLADDISNTLWEGKSKLIFITQSLPDLKSLVAVNRRSHIYGQVCRIRSKILISKNFSIC